MFNIPGKKWNYMNNRYSSSNYGAHSLAISIGNLELYFSYDTVVAFRYKGKTYVSENCWGATTGKHLNAIEPDKKRRIKREVFKNLLSKALIDFKWSQVLE